MFLFGQRSTLRRLAAQVLLVWLFALASTMANACMAVPPALKWAGHAAQHLPCHGDVHDDVHGAQASTSASSGACIKFCIDKSGSAPLNEQGLDLQGTQWLALPPAAVPDLHAAPERSTHADAQRPPPGARVPIPIAFLRLTR